MKLYVVKHLDNNYEWDFIVVVAQDCWDAEELARKQYCEDEDIKRSELDDDVVESFNAYEYDKVYMTGTTYKIELIDEGSS